MVAFHRPSSQPGVSSIAGDSGGGAPGAKVKEMVMMLDLDKCAIFGNDGNDLGNPTVMGDGFRVWGLK